MIGLAFAGGLDQLVGEFHILMAAARIDVRMFEEHGGGQHHIGHGRRVSHELLMHDGEEILAGEALSHQRLIGRDRHGIGVLDEHGHDRPAAFKSGAIPREDRADARLIEHAGGGVDEFAPFQRGLLPVIDRRVVMKGAAAFIFPGARDGCDAEGRMHVHRAIALAREAIAEPEEGALSFANELREGLDLSDAETRNR